MKLIICTLLLFALIQINILPQMKTDNTNDSFNNFLNTVREADENEKQLFADKFLEDVKVKSYPIYENDSVVVLLYNGDVENVSIIGDMTNWASSVPLQKIEGTNLFYIRSQFEPEARLEYLFELSKDEFPVIDSFNEYKSLNGFGELSELAMPRYIRHPIFKEYERGRKGHFNELRELQISSNTLGYDHTLHVYLPPGYHQSKKYPSIYFQDGKDYIEFALAPHILNELIIQGLIEPVIAVFVTPPNLHQPKMPNRMTEYGMNDDYVDFFTKELVPFIDSEFSTLPQRLVIGDSYGGLISTYISFSYPEIFQKAYSQSGYFSFNKDRMIKLLDSVSVKPIELFIDIGTYEESVGASFLPQDETNFLEGNRRFKEALIKNEYNFVYKEYYEGHTWGNWRRHLIDALIHFFNKNELRLEN
jgi:enterochelin esterase-like enzyme